MKKQLTILLCSTALAFAVTGAARADELFQTKLSGANEVGPVATGTSGAFKLLLNPAETAATYDLRVRAGLKVTQAHLHCAAAGVNGPVVVFLAGFAAAGWDVNGDWIGEATITDASIINIACGDTLSELAEAMRDGDVYVNVHTIANPGGEIRGQVD